VTTKNLRRPNKVRPTYHFLIQFLKEKVLSKRKQERELIEKEVN